MLRLDRRALLFALAVLMPAEAGAVSERVRKACRSDYFAYCSAYQVGSQELRQCMRKVGSKLQRGCVDALVAAGEVSAKEVATRRRLAKSN